MGALVMTTDIRGARGEGVATARGGGGFCCLGGGGRRAVVVVFLACKMLSKSPVGSGATTGLAGGGGMGDGA